MMIINNKDSSLQDKANHMPTSDFRVLFMDKVTQCCTVTIMHSDIHNTNNRSKHTYTSTCCQAPYFSVIIDQLATTPQCIQCARECAWLC